MARPLTTCCARCPRITVVQAASAAVVSSSVRLPCERIACLRAPCAAVIPNSVFSRTVVLNVTRKGKEWRVFENVGIRVEVRPPVLPERRASCSMLPLAYLQVQHAAGAHVQAASSSCQLRVAQVTLATFGDSSRFVAASAQNLQSEWRRGVQDADAVPNIISDMRITVRRVRHASVCE